MIKSFLVSNPDPFTTNIYIVSLEPCSVTFTADVWCVGKGSEKIVKNDTTCNTSQEVLIPSNH